MGRSTVEREGVSVAHAARFVLVGTMNPEEGELRPQLLDRFGLTVEVAAPRDPALRAEVVRRRLAYDADPDAFAARYADAEDALADRIRAAQARLGSVALGDGALTKIAEVCAAFEVDGMRADIVTARAAVAHAAWHGRTTCHQGRHPGRRPAGPAAPPPAQPVRRARPGRGPARPDPRRRRARSAGARPAAERRTEPGTTAPGPRPDAPDGQPTTRRSGTRPGAAGSTRPSSSDRRPSRAARAASGRARRRRLRHRAAPRRRLPDPAVHRRRHRRRRGRPAQSGRSPRPAAPVGAGPTTGDVRARAPDRDRPGRGAAPGGRAAAAGPACWSAATTCGVAIQEGRESNLVLFCVDASGSMAARRRMEQVKTAVLSLLARRLPAAGQGRAGHLPRGRGRAGAAADRRSVEVAARRLRGAAGRRPDPAGRGPAVRGGDPRPGTHPRPAAAAAAGRGHRRPGHLRRRRAAPLAPGGRAAGRRRGVAAAGGGLRDRPVPDGPGRAAGRDAAAPSYVPVGEVGAAALTSAVAAHRGAAGQGRAA